MTKPHIIVIEGNVGAGKTTLLGNLKKLHYTVFEEPVGLWQPLLELQQEDRSRWTFTLQMYALAHFIQLQKELCDIKDDIVFVERCAASSWVFTKTAYDDGVLTDLEFSVWNSVFKLLNKDPDTVIYLKAPVGVNLDRIRKRGRKGEETIDTKRLLALGANYNEIYKDKQIITLDCTVSQQELVNSVVAILKNL